jgi:prefoldin alpha subunit
MATELNEREVNVGSMPIDQLNGLKTQHENEIRELQGQLETLHGAKNRFIGARMTLDEMKKIPEGTNMLVPLNGSLYAPGFIASSEKVIVELGTGYFCEKEIPQAKELIARKMQLVDKSIESIENIGNRKRKNLEQIMQVMQYRLQMQENQRAA